MPRRSVVGGPLRRAEIVGVVVIIVAGTLLHFAFEGVGRHRFVALVAPVNESVWEHLKLVFYPGLGFAAGERFWIGRHARLALAKLIAVTTSMLVIVAVFYTYTGASGARSILAVDIASFCVAVIAGQFLSYRVLTSSLRPLRLASAAGIIAIAVAFSAFTFAPPHVPLFEDARTGVYGIP